MSDKVFGLIKKEEERQKNTLAMIASENYISRNVREALGSMLSNKYSEGYPGKRYYQGNRIVDEIEQLAIDRAKKLFNVPHANVQPYSGSPANSAVYMAVAEPGAPIMGLTLSGGGHLTHGHPDITFSGRYYRSVQFNVTESGYIDYDEAEELAKTHKPQVIMVGTTAYPRFIDWSRFAAIAEQCGAYVVADISHVAGLVAAGEYPSPVDYVHVITTTTHKTLRGPRGAMILVTEKGMAKDADLPKKIDRAVFPGLQGGPHNTTTAAIAVALGEADTPEFKRYAHQVVLNAKILAMELAELGYALTTGGTDSHVLVIDLRPLGIGGKEAAVQLEEAGIVVNYNTVPHDSNPPSRPSGIRVGTPALTTRGMKEEEMKLIAGWIDEVLRGGKTREVLKKTEALSRKFKTP